MEGVRKAGEKEERESISENKGKFLGFLTKGFAELDN